MSRTKRTMRSPASQFLPAVPALALAWTLAGCATKPPATDPDALAEYNQTDDPLEPTNRFFYKVNDKIDTYALRPVAVAYRDYVPGVVRRPIHNVLANISSPIIFANDVLQAKPRRAGDTMMRFLINSTVGVGGLFDVASGWGYPDHATDFGVTLALWGVDAGPFLFLPVLGPSNPRDAVGFAGNAALDPFFYASFGGSTVFQTSRFIAGAVDTRERALGVTENVNRTALDPYATFRSLYRQNRASVIERTRNADRTTTPAWFPSDTDRK